MSATSLGRNMLHTRTYKQFLSLPLVVMEEEWRKAFNEAVALFRSGRDRITIAILLRHAIAMGWKEVAVVGLDVILREINKNPHLLPIFNRAVEGPWVSPTSLAWAKLPENKKREMWYTLAEFALEVVSQFGDFHLFSFLLREATHRNWFFERRLLMDLRGNDIKVAQTVLRNIAKLWPELHSLQLLIRLAGFIGEPDVLASILADRNVPVDLRVELLGLGLIAWGEIPEEIRNVVLRDGELKEFVRRLRNKEDPLGISLSEGMSL